MLGGNGAIVDADPLSTLVFFNVIKGVTMDRSPSLPLSVVPSAETTRRVASAQLLWLKAILAAAVATWQSQQSK
jgi:hypothetical protein